MVSSGFPFLVDKIPAPKHGLMCPPESCLLAVLNPAPIFYHGMIWPDLVTRHFLGGFAALFLHHSLLRILLLFYFISRLSWCHPAGDFPTLLARTGMLCYLLSADTQHPPQPSKFILYHRGWKSGNYITQIPCPQSCSLNSSNERIYMRLESRKKRINHYLLPEMADRWMSRWQLLVVLLLPHFLKANISFPLSLLPQFFHQFYKYWISCNKILPLEIWGVVFISLIGVLPIFSSN